MLSVTSLREHCLKKRGSQEPFPFGLSTLVFKVAGKLYALCNLESDPLELSLTCNPDEAEALRQRCPAVRPGYHLNKRHWNTVTCNGSAEDELILEWLDASYDLVVAALPKRVQAELQER